MEQLTINQTQASLSDIESINHLQNFQPVFSSPEKDKSSYAESFFSNSSSYILLYTSLDHPTDSALKSYSTKLGSISPKKNISSRYICVGYVDAQNEESFTLEAFESMIRFSYQKKKVFILARVTTCDPVDSNRLYHSFYYAPQINRVLFRTEKPTGAHHAFLHRMHAKNPLNNMPIIGDVEYFIITPEDVDIAKKSTSINYDDPSYLKASLLDLEAYLVSEKNLSGSQLEYMDQFHIDTATLYRAHYLACDEDFLRCYELRAYFSQNSISDDCVFFEYQRPLEMPFDGTEPYPTTFPYERYGFASNNILLNPDRMVIDISAMHPVPSAILCNGYFSNKSKAFRRNFFISFISVYLLSSLALLIFIIPTSLKGIIGIVMVIGLCAVLILFIENDRFSLASSTAAAMIVSAERRQQQSTQQELQRQSLSTTQQPISMDIPPPQTLLEVQNTNNIPSISVN